MSNLLATWNAILFALQAKDSFDDDTCAVVHRSDFDDSGELRGIGEIVDYSYSAGDGRVTSDEPIIGGGLRPRLPANVPAYIGQIISGTWRKVGEGIEDFALLDDTPALVSAARWDCNERGEWEHIPALYEGGRLAHERDEYVKGQHRDAIEPTGYAADPRATYLWQSGRQREERTSDMLQVIAYGPLPRVLKARQGIKTQRNESICATLGTTLPREGSWPGVEAHSNHGMVRHYIDSAGVEVTRIPDWSGVWLTKSQQADLMVAVGQRLNGETVTDALPVVETDSTCCRCDTVTSRVAFDPSTGVPLCHSCWLECNPGEVTIAEVTLSGGAVDWTTELTEGLLATL